MTNLLALIAAMAISMVLIPLVSRFAPRLGLIDAPDARKVHAVPVPRVGGVGLVIGSLVPLMLLLEPSRLSEAFVWGGSILFLFGLWDDAFEIGHYPKFIGQIAAALTVVLYGELYVTRFPFVPGGELPPEISIPFSVIAIVGMINAINHSDGLDGLASGESLISLGAICFIALLTSGGQGILIISTAVMGGILGFLRYNTHPARVFMGDSGSQFLGYALAFLVLLLTQRVDLSLSPGVVLLLLGLPIADILVVFYKRARSGMNVFKATRNHIHHRLLDLGFVHHESVILIYSAQILFVISGILLRQQPDYLLIGVYLIYCMILFGLLNMAEHTGWTLKRKASVNQRVLTHEWMKSLLVVLPRRFISVAIPALFVGASVLVTRIPDDFAKLALLVSGLMIIELFASRGQQSLMRRALIYVFAVQIGYLWFKYPPWPPEIEYIGFVQALVFSLLAVAFVTAVKFSPRRRSIEFVLSATDYLVAFCLLAVLVLTKNGFWDHDIFMFVAQMVIVFYACELQITEKRSGWSWLSISVILSGMILGGRWLIV